MQVHNPQSLAAAMSLARQLELREQFTAPSTTVSRAGARPLLPAPRLLLPAPATTSPPAAIEGRPPIKRLTSAKQEERRRLGLCYNCDEKFSRGHNRVCKRLVFLDGTVEDDDTEEPTEEVGSEESPAFSL